MAPQDFALEARKQRRTVRDVVEAKGHPDVNSEQWQYSMRHVVEHVKQCHRKYIIYFMELDHVRHFVLPNPIVDSSWDFFNSVELDPEEVDPEVEDPEEEDPVWKSPMGKKSREENHMVDPMRKDPDMIDPLGKNPEGEDHGRADLVWKDPEELNSKELDPDLKEPEEVEPVEMVSKVENPGEDPKDKDPFVGKNPVKVPGVDPGALSLMQGPFVWGCMFTPRDPNHILVHLKDTTHILTLTPELKVVCQPRASLWAK